MKKYLFLSNAIHGRELGELHIKKALREGKDIHKLLQKTKKKKQTIVHCLGNSLAGWLVAVFVQKKNKNKNNSARKLSAVAQIFECMLKARLPSAHLAPASLLVSKP